MIYLSQLLGNPVFDANGTKIGRVNDLGIATGEVFPRITALAVEGPGKTPFMISWRKYVENYSESEIHLKVISTDIRFSYLQPNEVLIARDLLNKQIVDTRGMCIVRVNDLKLSDTSWAQLRLLGAEVGIRGILRSLSPALETLALAIAKAMGKPLPEKIIAWNYMDLLDRNLSEVKLSVSHKTLDGLHPADIADILERLDPRLRGQVFAQLDDDRAADAMAEFDDDTMAAEIMDELPEKDASRMLSEMDPDDAAELVSELDYDKAEKLLRLMGVKERKAIRQLLGYREDTAGRIMTSEVVRLNETKTVADAADVLKSLDDDFETVHYIYLEDDEKRLVGVVTLNQLIVHESTTVLKDIATSDVICVSPDDDQEEVAENIAKYNLLAMPVCDDNKRLLGIVTVDDALDVMEEEHEEDLQIAGASSADGEGARSRSALVWLWRHTNWMCAWLVCACALFACTLGNLSFIAPALYMKTSFDLTLLCSTLMAPVCLILADTSISHVTNFYLENDPDDPSTPSDLGFFVKCIGIALVFVVLFMLFMLVFQAFIQELGMLNTASSLVVCFISCMVSVAQSFITAPIYLKVLRMRDARNLDTSGFALSSISMAISCCVYIVCVLAIIPTMVWG